MSDLTDTPFDEVTQLQEILCRWNSEQLIDIEGVFIDYMSRNGYPLIAALDLNRNLAVKLFPRDDYSRASQLLLAVTESASERNKIKEECHIRYPLIAELIAKVDAIHSPSNFAVNKEITAFDVLETSDTKTIIWQISDIHFGRLNMLHNDPIELASIFGHLVGTHPSTKPDYIIISGDITSSAAEEEFTRFAKFCKELSIQLWDSLCPQRILLVPGNHDITWSPDGSADRLKLFADMFGDERVCVTPFGKEESFFKDPTVRVRRYGLNDSESPPLAVVSLEEAGIEVLLLVSAYYSGIIPEELRHLLRNEVNDEDARSRLIKHLRSDTGEISVQYLSLLARSLDAKPVPRLAVTHHHFTQYGAECSLSKYGYDLMKTLSDKGVSIVLHGHLHMFEARTSSRVIEMETPCCIPCTTLTAHTWRRSQGFMIHVVDSSSDGSMISLEWELAEGRLFHLESLQPAYSATLSSNPRAKRLIVDK